MLKETYPLAKASGNLKDQIPIGLSHSSCQFQLGFNICRLWRLDYCREIFNRLFQPFLQRNLGLPSEQ